jgi:capsid protein
VNFSSIRSGVLEEREHWRILQKWISEQLHRPVYQAWLAQALRTQALKLPEKKFKKFTKVNWQPRGWAWVDPLKDQQANQLMVQMGTGTLTAVCAAQGLNFIDVCAERQAELAILEQYGLTPDEIINPKTGAANEQDD